MRNRFSPSSTVLRTVKTRFGEPCYKNSRRSLRERASDRGAVSDIKPCLPESRVASQKCWAYSGLLVVVCVLLVAATSAAPEFNPRQAVPRLVMSSATCTKCHQPEMNAWMATPHYSTFETLHRTPEAKAIADRLGLRSVKRNDVCISCHYTQQMVDDRPRIIEGVSCESCHGGARDWLELHADYGGPGIDATTESPAHRQQRRDASIAAGMNNPSNLYLVARQCLSCHTVPNEELVNKGGHKAGSLDFELVAWSQGMVRHNFLRGGGANVPSDPARLRVMYVVGLLADLEASLRAVAVATTPDTFGTTSATRAANIKQRLWQIQRAIDHPLLAKALAPLATIELRIDNRAAIVAAADIVGESANEFATTVTGDNLEAIDSLLPTTNQYRTMSRRR